MEYVFHILVLITIYTMVVSSLDLVAGHGGLLSLAQASFYGIGAYTAALLSIRLGVPLPFGLAAAVLLAAVASLFVSLPSMRLQDDYFVIATFGFQMIAFAIFNNWIELTRGPMGLPAIPSPSLAGFIIQSPAAYLMLLLPCAAASVYILWRLMDAPFGRVLRAIREDEGFAQAAGKDTVGTKVSAFAASAAVAGLAGGFYAHYVTYIDPTSFTVNDSILILSMLVIGGPATKYGPVIGSAVLVVLPELLRLIGLPTAIAANVRQLLYGTALVVIVAMRPQRLARAGMRIR